MSIPNIILQEIYFLTEKLISINLSVSQNYPSSTATSNHGVEITFSGASNLSVALKILNIMKSTDNLIAAITII